MTSPEQARAEATQAAVEARLMGLETHVQELQSLIGELSAELRGRRADPASAFDVAELDSWVRDWLLPTFRRLPGSSGGHWCRQWWAHPEAVLRLVALHLAWKQLCGDGGAGLSVWLREHLDPALVMLLGDPGPFMTCKTSPPRHDPVEPLPADPLPEGLIEEFGVGSTEGSTDGHGP